MVQSISCNILRGGTSKGVFFLEKDLPPMGAERDKLLLRIMGSPDTRQIDGLGGATSTTSKVAILAPGKQDGIDVDYTFAQVSVDKAVVSYSGNCGNISSAVGPFAVDCGLVKASDPVTKVRILNTNTNKILVEEVQTPGGKICYDGDFEIPGVPGTAAPVKLHFVEPAGSMGKGLLPTGNVIDKLIVEGIGSLEISIVDAANPLVFVRAEDVGMTGKELPSEIDGNKDLLELLENIRGSAAVLMGLTSESSRAAWETPGVPKMTIVSAPGDYVSSDGKNISSESIDLISRMMSMQKAHPTYAMTGAVCTAAAAVIPGSLVNQACRKDMDPACLRIGQPKGVLETGVEYSLGDGGATFIESAYGYRTARLLMKGCAYL